MSRKQQRMRDSSMSSIESPSNFNIASTSAVQANIKEPNATSAPQHINFGKVNKINVFDPLMTHLVNKKGEVVQKTTTPNQKKPSIYQQVLGGGNKASKNSSVLQQSSEKKEESKVGSVNNSDIFKANMFRKFDLNLIMNPDASGIKNTEQLFDVPLTSQKSSNVQNPEEDNGLIILHQHQEQD